MAKRSLTVQLQTTSGTINRFYAFVGGKRVISADGTKKPKWTGEVDDQARLKVRVWGIDDAQYKLSIDLPGTADDQQLTLRLKGGYHELELEI